MVNTVISFLALYLYIFLVKKLYHNYIKKCKYPRIILLSILIMTPAVTKISEIAFSVNLFQRYIIFFELYGLGFVDELFPPKKKSVKHRTTATESDAPNP